MDKLGIILIIIAVILVVRRFRTVGGTADNELVKVFAEAIATETEASCTTIIKGLEVVDDKLVLNGSYQSHLQQCPDCRALLKEVQEASKESVPDYASGAMERIRKIEKNRRGER